MQNVVRLNYFRNMGEEETGDSDEIRNSWKENTGDCLLCEFLG